MTSTSRLHRILEQIRALNHEQLRAEFVEQIADLEERNVFDDDRSNALKEIRQFVAIEVQSEKVSEGSP